MVNRRDRRRAEREAVRRSIRNTTPHAHPSPHDRPVQHAPPVPDLADRLGDLVQHIGNKNHAALGLVALRGDRGLGVGIDALVPVQWLDARWAAGAGLYRHTDTVGHTDSRVGGVDIVDTTGAQAVPHHDTTGTKNSMEHAAAGTAHPIASPNPHSYPHSHPHPHSNPNPNPNSNCNPNPHPHPTAPTTLSVWATTEPAWTLLACAAKLRRDRCVQALLFGGADATVRWVTGAHVVGDPVHSASHADGRADGRADGQTRGTAHHTGPVDHTVDTSRPSSHAHGDAVRPAAAPRSDLNPNTHPNPNPNPQSNTNPNPLPNPHPPLAVPQPTAGRVARLLNDYPDAYAVWVVCEVVSMRELGVETVTESTMQSAAAASSGGDKASPRCALCHTSPPASPTCWSRACGHLFCEPCLWEALLDRASADQLYCPAPACNQPRPTLTSDQLAAAAHAAYDPPMRECKARYDALPDVLGSGRSEEGGREGNTKQRKPRKFRAVWSLRMAHGGTVRNCVCVCVCV